MPCPVRQCDLEEALQSGEVVLRRSRGRGGGGRRDPAEDGGVRDWDEDGGAARERGD